jgi:chemotaxis protein methyltransferase CheR
VSQPARLEGAAKEATLSKAEFRAIAAMLYADTGIHLPATKASLVYSRLAKRLRALNLESFHDYCELVSSEAGRAERGEMLSALTTNVTRFFRERHHFDHLECELLPPLLARARAGGKVRLWSAACSTGQEAYSIALCVLAVDPQAPRYDVKILATDIDPRVVAEAKAGVYSAAALSDVPADQRARRFAPQGEGFSIDDDARALISFRVLNLNGEWPMRGAFDAIFCRNVAIYFDDATQHKLWSRFARQLAPQGWLYIGHSERVAGPAAQRLVPAGVTAYRLSGASQA